MQHKVIQHEDEEVPIQPVDVVVAVDGDVVAVEEVQHNITIEHMQCKVQQQIIQIRIHHNSNIKHVHELIHEQDGYNRNHQINYGHDFNMQHIYQKYMIHS